MNIDEQILSHLQKQNELLEGIRKLLSNDNSQFCDRETACHILGFFGATKKRKLAALEKDGIVNQVPGRKWVYRKEDLYMIANKKQ